MQKLFKMVYDKIVRFLVRCCGLLLIKHCSENVLFMFLPHRTNIFVQLFAFSSLCGPANLRDASIGAAHIPFGSERSGFDFC